jgi:hypothetical protein
MVPEAFAIIRGARDRYDGRPRAPIPRNPWNEIECGGHYARAMSSWSLLLALSGYEYDGPAAILRFTPRYQPHHFKSFFCGPEGWGSLRQLDQGNGQLNEVSVAYGAFTVSRLILATTVPAPKATVHVDQAACPASLQIVGGQVTVTLGKTVKLTAGQRLTVRLT